MAKVKRSSQIGARMAKEVVHDSVEAVAGSSIGLTKTSQSVKLIQIYPSYETKTKIQLIQLPKRFASQGTSKSTVTSSSMIPKPPRSSRNDLIKTGNVHDDDSYRYQYEIDCAKVADSIAVIDLVSYFPSDLLTLTNLLPYFLATAPRKAFEDKRTKRQFRKHSFGQQPRSQGNNKIENVLSQKISSIFVEEIFEEELEYPSCT